MTTNFFQHSELNSRFNDAHKNHAPDNKVSHLNYFSQFELINDFLKELIDNPGSSRPFEILLEKFEMASGAVGSAIYKIRENGCFSLHATTNESDTYIFSHFLNNIPIDTIARITNYKDGYKIILIRLLDEKQGNKGLLFLKFKNQGFNVSSFSSQQLEYFSKILGNIFNSTQQAYTKKRMALHEERALIARELHDSLAQSLSYIKIQATRLQNLLKKNVATQNIDNHAIDGIVEELRNNINLTYKELRELITTFRLTINYGSLAGALEDSIEEFKNRSSIAFHLDNRLSVEDLTTDEEIHVLQIVREALTNVVKHAHANRAEITLYSLPPDKIILNIDDDGIGLKKTPARNKHHGMIIMQQRAHSLDGSFRVHSSPLGGMRTSVMFATKNKV